MNVNFNTYVPPVPSGRNNQNENKEYAVTALNLADGEDTIVRFPYKATSEFDLRTTHVVKIGNWYKKINCLGSVSECPLCARGDKLSTRFFAHLLQYTQLPDGTVSTKAKIWDVGYEIAQALAGYINLYGDLSKLVFKLSRSGQRFETKYNLILLPSEMYPATIYRDDFKDFDNFRLTNFFCLTKTAAEMTTYINTGNFPMNNNQQRSGNSFNVRATNSVSTPQYTSPVQPAQPVQPTQPAAPTRIPAVDAAPNTDVPGAFAPQSMEEVLQSQPTYTTPTPASAVIRSTYTDKPLTVGNPAAAVNSYSEPVQAQAPVNSLETSAQEAAPRPRRYAY